MKTSRWILLLTYFIVGISCVSKEEIPWSDDVWLKGNLHTHSLWSDGDDYPEMIMEWYKSHNYQFVGLSDHNILQEGEKWSSVTQSPTRKKAFEKYQKFFGNDWVEFREDSSGTSVRLKELEEYRSRFENEDFLILKSEEITSSFEGNPIHVNATNIRELIPTQTGESVLDVMQNAVDAVLEQRERTGTPMFPHINHPNFGWGISTEDMKGLRGERFFEVYNGHPAVNNYGDQSRPSTEEMWDEINISYLSEGRPPIFGIATDDSHNYHLFGSQFSNTGRGWVMVNSVELSPEALIGAMEAGRFYASSGVVIQKYFISSKKISFEIQSEEGINFITQFIGVNKGENKSSVLKEISGQSVEYNFTGNELFVRARIISNKLKVNPFSIGEYESAWTQPVVPQY